MLSVKDSVAVPVTAPCKGSFAVRVRPPTAPPGSTEIGGALRVNSGPPVDVTAPYRTRMVEPMLAVITGVLESVTWTEIGKLPRAVGVPVIFPVPVWRVSPAGRVPEVNTNV